MQNNNVNHEDTKARSNNASWLRAARAENLFLRAFVLSW